jgi:PAS domain S-box-containing protein
MNNQTSKQSRKQALKDIILSLHQGLSPQRAKERFEKEIGSITSAEIASLEQELIEEGLSPDEVRKFCNVHALIFKSALEQKPAIDTNPAHPIYLFKLENREIEKVLAQIKELIQKRNELDLSQVTSSLNNFMKKLQELEKHYARKEQLLFPFLDKKGFTGPSKVMWAKDNEIRELLKTSMLKIDGIKTFNALEQYIADSLNPLISEVEGMIFKEENILFPTSLEKLNPEDWVDILKESDEIGYTIIKKPEEAEVLSQKLQEAICEEPVHQEGKIIFPSGTLPLSTLMHLLNTLPVDITFVDQDDIVRYFSEKKERIFFRPRAVLGRKVQNCHPPQSVHIVEKILSSFKEGKRDSFDFRINYKGKYVYILYLAVRDDQNKYLGTLEVTQDITEIHKLTGEKRLLDLDI